MISKSKNAKKVYFVRHGEALHNVAQREWRSQPDWDGVSDPYTFPNDPEFKYIDPVLTEEGERQAKELQLITVCLFVMHLHFFNVSHII